MYVVSSDQTVCLYNIEQVRAPYIRSCETTVANSAQPVNACVQNEEIAKLDDARQALAGVVPIDYVIDCQYDAASDGLFMLTGTYGYTHHARAHALAFT
jgi:hypothetical protein